TGSWRPRPVATCRPWCGRSTTRPLPTATATPSPDPADGIRPTGQRLALCTVQVLPESEWRERAAAHAAAVDVLTAGRLERRSDGRKHPVEDFLFEYYNHRPGQLRRWHPGAGVALEGAAERADWSFYSVAGGRATLDAE